MGVRVFHCGKRFSAAMVYIPPDLGRVDVHSQTAPEKWSFVQRTRWPWYHISCSPQCKPRTG